MLGIVTFGIVLLAWIVGIVLSAVMIGSLVNRRWSMAAKCFAGAAVMTVLAAAAANFGVPEWNKAIAAKNAREHIHINWSNR